MHVRLMLLTKRRDSLASASPARAPPSSVWLLLPHGRFAFCSLLRSPGEPLPTPRTSRASRPQPSSCASWEDGRTISSHSPRVAFEALPFDWWEIRSVQVFPDLSRARMLSRFSRVRLCRPHGLQPTRLFCLWDSPGKNPGMGCMTSSRGSSRPRDRPSGS